MKSDLLGTGWDQETALRVGSMKQSVVSTTGGGDCFVANKERWNASRNDKKRISDPG
jgi:hypothetical protein